MGFAALMELTDGTMAHIGKIKLGDVCYDK